MLKSIHTKLAKFISNQYDHVKSITQDEPLSLKVSYTDFEFNLGDELSDRVTGSHGIVIGSTQWINNCNTFKLACCELDSDGKHKEEISIDAPLLKLYSPNSVDVDVEYKHFKYDLGDMVITKIDGFKGIIGARCAWLAGCNNYLLKAKGLGPVGSIQAGEWVSEDMVDLIYKNPFFREVAKKEKPKPVRNDTGGPTNPVINNRF